MIFSRYFIKDRKKCLFFPCENEGNKYIDLIKESLNEEFSEFTQKMSFSNLLTTKVAILHWRENKFISSNGKVNYIGFLKEILRVLIFKVFFVKTILFAHNKYPHSTDVEHIPRVKKLQDFYYSMCYKIFCHSPKHSENIGASYLPHPRYYFDEDIVIDDLKQNSERYIIIFGRIERYKRIEEILYRWNTNYQLLVVGPCGDVSYLNELKDISNERVKFIPKFLEEEELNRLVIGSDFVILPSDSKDMIVSGSFHYALSLQKNVLCIHSEYVQWFSNYYKEVPVQVFENTTLLMNYLSDKENKNSEVKCSFDRYNIDHSLINLGKILKYELHD